MFIAIETVTYICNLARLVVNSFFVMRLWKNNVITLPYTLLLNCDDVHATSALPLSSFMMVIRF